MCRVPHYSVRSGYGLNGAIRVFFGISAPISHALSHAAACGVSDLACPSNERVAGSSPASGASPPSALQSLSDAQFSLSGAVDGLVTVSGSLSGVGSAGRVQVIEKTGRGWKAIRLLGWLLVTGGVLMLRASPATHAADARRFGWLIAGAGVSFKLTHYRPAGQ
jgi:hypothetical protein